MPAGFDVICPWPSLMLTVHVVVPGVPPRANFAPTAVFAVGDNVQLGKPWGSMAVEPAHAPSQPPKTHGRCATARIVMLLPVTIVQRSVEKEANPEVWTAVHEPS